eukprot:jgi/Mesen1/10463/ME000082S09966
MQATRRQAWGTAYRFHRVFPGPQLTYQPSENSGCFNVDSKRTATSLAVRSSVAAKGPGGRSSVSGIVAVVYGATGFLGRYIVQQLAKSGTQVVVPYRGLEDSQRHLKLMGDLGQVVPVRFDVRNEESIMATMAKANVVINVMGKEYETRNYSFEDINVDAAARIARLAADHGGVMRYMHVSCLGASPHAPSKQHQTKAAGEAATLAAFPEATVLRPGPLVGTEDRLLNAWASMAKKLPAVPVIAGGGTLMQPVYVMDVANALLAALLDDGTSCSRTYELGGPQVLSILDLVHLTFETIRQHPRTYSIPMPLAKLLATPRELLLRRLPFPIPAPTMFTLDYIKSLEFDHVVGSNALGFKDLGLEPSSLKGTAIEHLFAYRSGGPTYGDTVGESSTGGGAF